MRYHFIVLIFIIALFAGCKDDPTTNTTVNSTSEAPFDLDKINLEGKLKVLIGYSSTSYFIYRGTPMGFEYELLQKLAEHLNVDLEIIPINDLDSIYEYLEDERGDLVAANLTVTKERLGKMSFTEPIAYTTQVLVQKKPDNWRKIPKHRTEEQLIREPMELAYKKVHIRRNSSFYERLVNLSEEIGEPIQIEEVQGLTTTEKLISMVAEGEILYTVADKYVAEMNALNYDDIDVSTPISFKQKIAWGLRKSSPKLLEEINKWLESYSRTTEFAVIYNKYYKNKSRYKKRVSSDYYSATSGKISAYDKLIKKYSKVIDWDWKLLASLIYQESQFKPTAKSWTGAFGLMQIMPTTAAQYGIDSTAGVEANIKAGVKYLEWIDERWKKSIKDSTERVKFVMASYNVGLGHIMDARNLAAKHGLDPQVWENNVEVYLLKKSNSKYYKDPVVKHGYCRCTEPYQYVREIMERYEDYQNIIQS